MNCIPFGEGKLRYWSSGVGERLIYLLIQCYHLCYLWKYFSMLPYREGKHSPKFCIISPSCKSLTYNFLGLYNSNIIYMTILYCILYAGFLFRSEHFLPRPTTNIVPPETQTLHAWHLCKSTAATLWRQNHAMTLNLK